MLWSFVAALKRAFDEDVRTDEEVLWELNRLREALDQGRPGELRAIAERASESIEEALRQRRTRHEDTVRSLGTRLAEARGALREASVRAETDSLTGIPNRAALDRRMRHSVALHDFTGQPACLLLLDLDHFKSINTKLGHCGGDRVLRSVGSLLQREILRRNDFVARLGGEEFAVVLEDSTALDGVRVGERLLSALEDLAVVHRGKSARVTASVGVAALQHGDSESSWLEAADRAMFRAKDFGRNQLVVSDACRTVGEDGASR